MSTCIHAGRCGGCAYLNIPYPEELFAKEKALRETLGQYAPLLEGLRPAPATSGYRNKMELAFGDDGGKEPRSALNRFATGAEHGSFRRLSLGIRKKRSFYEVATTENCVLMPDDFKKIAAYAQDFFRQTGEAFYHRKAHTGTLRHLVLRRGHFTGELLVMLSTTSGLSAAGCDALLKSFVQGLRDLPTSGPVVGVLHAVNDAVSDTVKNENLNILWGRDFYREKLCGLMFYVSAFSFFQTNSAGAEVLYDIVKGFAADGGTAFDLYCGTGTIAQIIAPRFERVIGVELSPEAIAAAQANAKLNNITNCEFHARDITKIAGQKGNKTGILTGTPNVIIVDPPRDGLSPKALAKIVSLAPKRLVYVACKPASLARDLPALAAGGMKPVRIIGVDLFPRTPHVEAVCLLERG